MAELGRTLTLRNAVFLVVGNVVGAGIFATPGFLAGEVGSPLVFLGAWVAGGLLTLAGALTYAELGALFPRAGGDYQFLKEAFGPLAGFLSGWLGFWVITPGSIAALSIALARNLPGLPDLPGLEEGLAFAAIAAFSLLNWRGARPAAGVQDVVTAGTVILLLALVIGGFLAGDGDGTNFTATSAGAAKLASGSAMIAVLFTYSGWFASAYVGSEIVDAPRNVPRSLVLGTLVVAALYTAVNAVFLYAVPLAEMQGQGDVGRLAAERLFGPGFGLAAAVAIALAIASCVNATVMTGARITFAMAADGVFFRRLGAVHPRFATPGAAILAQALVAGALVALGSFETLLSWVVVAMLLSSIAAGVGLFVLRIRRPELARPYRTLGYPVVPALFVLSYGAIAAAVAVGDPPAAAAGVGIALSGVPFWFVWRRRSPGEGQVDR
jgi:APA family basic amino acid/polyamine antiporter